jgi:hypothetical protein
MKWNKKPAKRADTYTPSEEGVIEFMNIDKQFHLVPQKISLAKWYKDMPGIATLYSGQKEDMTIKKCIPILDALTMGYYLVTKEDYIFSYDEELKHSKFTGPASIMDQEPISRHPATQISTVSLSPEYIHEVFKWKNSWLIKTPPGYSCLFTHPLDGIEDPFKTLDGVVDTDNFFMPVLFPFLMKNNFEGVIPAGTPVVQIIPFKRTNWTMEINEDLNKDLETNYHAEKTFYMSEQYNKDGSPNPGKYKREYRVKKRYT